MQNHLTELLALITMDLDDDDLEGKKVDAIRRMASVKKGDLILGQYSKYVEQGLCCNESIIPECD